MKNDTWVITGASSGFGFELTKYLLKNNKNVLAFSRTPAKITEQLGTKENLLALSVNLNDITEITKALKLAIEKFNTIDIVVNNAGYSHFGPFESLTIQEIEEEFKVNIFYAFNMLKAVLPILRKQHSGHIFNTSSIAGYVGYPFASIYTATKFALDGFSEALNGEVNQFNISVSSILPGSFRTNILDKNSLKLANNEIIDYNAAVKEYETRSSNANHKQLGDPVKYAEFLYNLTKEQKIPVHIFVGKDATDLALSKAKEIINTVTAYKNISDATGFEDFTPLTEEPIKI